VTPGLIREFPGLKVVIAGPDWGYAGELKKMTTSLGLEKHVIFTGVITDKELREALFYADVFVLPSELENFPQIMLKPAFLEKPIVASKTGGIPEFIEDGKTGLLVDVGDREGLFWAIKTLLSNPELAKRLGKKARERVLKEDTTTQIAAKTLKVFNEVLGE
jgi:glycosyltransferase involved in cell wall biosynthesis